MKEVEKKVKPAVLQALLINGYEQNIYDLELFMNFCECPCSYMSFLQNKYQKKSGDYSQFISFIQYKSNLTQSRSLEVVGAAHIDHFLQNKKDLKTLSKYLVQDQLERILVKNMALAGASLMDYKELAGPEQAEELENLKILDFAIHTKRQFDRNEPVEVFLKLKNIQKLVCKVFEVDTLHYYQTHNKELDETIDLDGLKPEDTIEFRFAYPKQQQHVQKIVLEEITKKPQGLFIAEFIGGAISCRMIIRKGVLQLLPALHHQGITFTIIDEKKQVCSSEGSGILMDGKFYDCGKDGNILFPFQTSPLNDKQVIIVHQGFCSLTKLSIPQETYSLKTAPIFNEEGLVRDQINNLVLRLKLYLNNAPITVKKIDSCDVVIESKDFEQITNVREFKDLSLNDNEDIVLVLPTLKLASLMKIKTTIKLKDLRGNEVTLTSSHEISVDRDYKVDKFCTVHLRVEPSKNGKEYILELLGKNGEAIPNHKLHVQFLKVFGDYDFEKVIFTDQRGRANLRSVDDMKYILVKYGSDLKSKRLFVLPSEYDGIDIPSLIELCEGEKLLLPSLGKKINREDFELLKVGKNPYDPNVTLLLEDYFESLKTEMSSIVASNLPQGEYIFRYNLYPCKEIKIVVHNGSRWGNNPYMLAKKRSIVELKPESRYLSLNYVTRAGSNLHLNFSSNSFPTVRAHIFGYTFSSLLSTLTASQLSATNPSFSSSQTSLQYVSNSLLTNRQLSDELRYVQQRQSEQSMIGNTLAKPSLLLHRDKVRETKDDEEIVQTGKAFDGDTRKQIVQNVKDNLQVERELIQQTMCLSRGAMLYDIESKCDELESNSRTFYKSKQSSGGAMSMLKGFFGGKEKKFEGVDWSSRPRFEVRNETGLKALKIDNNMDYALGTGKSQVNLKPGDDGTIIVDLNKFEGSRLLQIVLVDTNGTTMKQLSFDDKSALRTKDLRVTESLGAGSIWIRDYKVNASVLREGTQAVEFKGLSGLEAVLIKNGKDLLDNLCTLGSKSFDIATLLELRFVANWPSLNHEEKLEKWEKYGGTEFSIFTYFRDRVFWKDTIMPLIQCKAKHSTEDILLLALETGSKHFLDQVPTWEETSSLGPLPLLLKCLLTPDYIDSAMDVVSGRAAHKSSEDMRLAIETMISQNDSNSAAQTTSSCKQTLTLGLEDHRTLSAMATKGKRREEKEGGLEDMKVEGEGKRGQEQSGGEGLLLCGSIEESIAIGGLIDIERKQEEVYLEEYKKAPPAWEFKERQEYFKGQIQRLPWKRFWLELLRNIKQSKNGELNFDQFVSTEDVVFMSTSATEILMALTFTKLPLGENKIITQEQTSEAAIVRAIEPFLFVTKSVKSVDEGSRQDSELVLSQKFYDPNDKLIYDKSDSSIFYIKEVKEFLTAKIYESRISVTNLSESVLNLQLITQIPQGSLPVYSLEDLRILSKKFPPMSTEFFTFRFYFPAVGAFSWYPATLTRNNRLASFAKQSDSRLTVVDQYSEENKPMATIKDIAAHGTSNDLLNFLENVNVFNSELVDLNSIVWVCKESQADFLRLVQILRNKGVFVQSVWRYSIFYGHEGTFKELVESTTNKFLQKYEYLSLPYGIEKQSFEVLEYDPLVNPRAHSLSTGKDEKGFNAIRNTSFRETYARFLNYCAEKAHLSLEDLVAMNGYWIAMDRIRDALDLNRRIKREFCQDGRPVSIQFDYICAYLSIYEEMPEFRTARKFIQVYREYPDLSWRERFLAIEHQLEEFDRGQLLEKKDVEEKMVRIKQNRELAEKTEYLKVERIRSEKDPMRWAVQVTHKNVAGLTFKFFKIDIELLFSMDPFMENKNTGICSVAPNKELKFRVAKADFFKKAVIEVPQELSKENLIVQVSTKDKLEMVDLYNSDLRVQLMDDYGLVRVLDNKGQDLHTCYVKSYSKNKAGQVVFHKDGYTDFRGIFDYCSTNSASETLSTIESFSLLVSHPNFGATLLTAKPPKPAAVMRSNGDDVESIDFRQSYEKHHRLPDYVNELN